MIAQIQMRRGTAASATSINPVLGQGEIGWETDTGYYKIGDGSTAWNSLLYSGRQISAFMMTLLDEADAAALRGTIAVEPLAVIADTSFCDQDFDTNTTLADLTGLSVTLPSTGYYIVEGQVNYTAANTAVGLKAGLTCTNFQESAVRVDLLGDGTTIVTGVISSSGGSVSETATPASGKSVAFYRGYVRTNSTNSTLKLQGARNTDTGDHTVTVSYATLRARFMGA